MKKITLLFAVALLLCALPACSDKSDKADFTKELIHIDMVATHAVDTEVSVAQLTFVPNSVAPWLGRIILLDDDGHLYSTDIEGRSPKPVGNNTYIDIFGLARDKAAGVFLAITQDHKIEAFIESDDEGNFSPMIYSGKSIDAKQFDLLSDTSGEVIKILGNKGQFYTASIVINDKVLETTIIKTAKSANGKTSSGDFGTIAGIEGSDKLFSITPNSFASSRDKNGLIIEPRWPADPPKFIAHIKNGLSVGGVEHVKHVASTSSNYGAGGYNTGVLALVDADANRIVFISLSYAERQFMTVLNPPIYKPEDEPEDKPKNTP